MLLVLFQNIQLWMDKEGIFKDFTYVTIFSHVVGGFVKMHIFYNLPKILNSHGVVYLEANPNS